MIIFFFEFYNEIRKLFHFSQIQIYFMNTSEEDKKISILYRFILVLFFYPIWSKESCNYIYIFVLRNFEEKLLD